MKLKYLTLDKIRGLLNNESYSFPVNQIVRCADKICRTTEQEKALAMEKMCL